MYKISVNKTWTVLLAESLKLISNLETLRNIEYAKRQKFNCNEQYTTFSKFYGDRVLYLFACLEPYLIVITSKNYCNNSETSNYLNVYCKPQFLLILLQFLAKHTYFRYDMLTDLTCVDHIYNRQRFSLVYNLLSISSKSRIFVRCMLSEINRIMSVTYLYPNANWLEREVWDMYGIFFEYHQDLRRILTDYGFEGFPLRKDFPLTGYVEVSYSHQSKNVEYLDVQLTQEFRYFELNNAWGNWRYSKSLGS